MTSCLTHGGELGEIARRFPEAPAPWLDLSTGINPVAYPIGILPAESWSRLPSHERLQALIDAASLRYGVSDRATIVAAPGTQLLIQLLPRLVPRSRVAVLGPTYEEHQACWARHGHDVNVVASLDAAAGADIVIVVNPNNPTGRLIPRSELARHDGVLIVDEAFADFLPPAASLAIDRPERTIVLRSFGKAYGLAGLRLGFALADQPIAAQLRSELGPWAVSGPALEIGRKALADTAWLEAAARRLDSDGRRLEELLRAAGFAILGGTPLFRLARHADVPGTVERLGRHGIHVRAFANHPDWLRFGLPGSDASFHRLAGALACVAGTAPA
jgi:cobalamin biosynthesis protein CobC